MTVAVLESGGANIASLLGALERLGADAKLTGDPGVVRSASHVILPGVGAAGAAMRHLHRSGLAALIPTLHQPVLGICLGMQLLYTRSEEGPARCLGILDGQVEAMTPTVEKPVPHMGWNRVRLSRESHLFDGIEDGAHFYFVHSYAADAGPATVATANYDGDFAAVVRKHNFIGTQFHPERSGSVGARLLSNFLETQP